MIVNVVTYPRLILNNILKIHVQSDNLKINEFKTIFQPAKCGNRECMFHGSKRPKTRTIVGPYAKKTNMTEALSMKNQLMTEALGPWLSSLPR